MEHLQQHDWWFSIIGARTVPDGVMGSALHANGLAVGRDYPEDLRRYRQETAGKVLIAGPNTARFVLPQHGTLGREVMVAGRRAPNTVPYTQPTLEAAIAAVDDGVFGEGRESVVIGGPTMIRGACELVRRANFPVDSGKRALLLLTEFYDTTIPRRYENDNSAPTLADLPDNVREELRIRQPNTIPGRPDYDFAWYSVG